MVEVLLAVVALALFALAGTVVWHAHRNETASRQQAAKSFQADLSHVTILLNTMREILQQQKELARQFNENLERKSGAIRQLASVAAENLQKLRETKRQVLEELEEAREELASLRQQTEYLRERAERSAALAQREAAVPELRPEEPLAPPRAKAAKSRASAKRKIPPAKSDVKGELSSPPEEPSKPESPLPLQERTPSPTPSVEAEEAHEPVTDLSIEYTESSREALRSLLGLDKPGLATASERRTALAETASAGTPNAYGRTIPSSVRSQVEEYYQAGMSVADIARELGLGRGEVRLILSVGKER